VIVAAVVDAHVSIAYDLQLTILDDRAVASSIPIACRLGAVASAFDKGRLKRALTLVLKDPAAEEVCAVRWLPRELVVCISRFGPSPRALPECGQPQIP